MRIRTQKAIPVAHSIARVISTSGQPLPANIRRSFEPYFGRDLSSVRVHYDFHAQQTAAALGAEAFTIGQHLVFRAGKYRPHSITGRKLIAHELAHVTQQAERSATGDKNLTATNAALLDIKAEQQAGHALSDRHPRRKSLHPLPVPSHPVLQRYGVPGELRCDELVDWLNTNSPYSPEWAQTNCNYAFNGGLRTRHRTLPDGTVEVTVSGHNKLTVSVNCPIDRPSWTPTRRPNRAAEVTAWGAMRASLDAHEQEHRRIGQEWRTTLQDRFRAVSFSVTGNSQEDAMAQAQAQTTADQQSWMTEAQAAQDAIDPFRGAVLTCP